MLNTEVFKFLEKGYGYLTVGVKNDLHHFTLKYLTMTYEAYFIL